MFKPRQQLLEDFAGVADERGIDLDVLVDFRAIDLDVNFAGFFGVIAQVAGDTIVKAHADRDEQIRFLNGVIDPGFSVHAHHAEVERVAGGEAADAEQGHGHGEIAGVDKFVEDAHGAGHHDAVSGKNQGTLGGVEKLDGALELGLVVVQALALGRKLRRGRVPVEIAGGLLRVLGDVDENGARAAGTGDDERLANGARDIFGAGDHHIVFGDGHGDAGNVDFLEGVGAEQLAADLSGDADDWRRVEHGGGDAGDHVGSAGAGSGHGDSYAAAGTRVAVGHVRGALFVADENVVQLGLAERVIDRKNRAAGVTEDVLHAEACQRFAENFRTGELHEVLEAVCATDEKLLGMTVTAPREAEETSSAYLAITPVLKRGAGAFQEERRRWISASVRLTLRVRFGMSNAMVSPSASAAMGPPVAASGATWPAMKPCVAPEKRPSVSSATESPKPAPTSAAVTCSISRMPGPPLGPS